MRKLFLVISLFSLFLTGCASVPVESTKLSDKAKEFNSPSKGKAGVYVYRADTHFGAALKKSIWIDKECIGETAKGVFFYHEVEGDKEHTFSTESEFSPNDVIINTATGNLYFLEQYIRFGLFVGGAGLEQKEAAVAKEEMASLSLATKGKCDEVEKTSTTH